MQNSLAALPVLPARLKPAASEKITLTQTVARKMLVPCLRQLSDTNLEAVRAAGRTMQIRVLGLTSLKPDVTPELVLITIESITVPGALHATHAVKAALPGRIH